MVVRVKNGVRAGERVKGDESSLGEGALLRLVRMVLKVASLSETCMQL